MKLFEAVKETCIETVEAITRFVREPREYRMILVYGGVGILPICVGFALFVLSALVYGLWVPYQVTITLVSFVIMLFGVFIWLPFWCSVLEKVKT